MLVCSTITLPGACSAGASSPRSSPARTHRGRAADSGIRRPRFRPRQSLDRWKIRGNFLCDDARRFPQLAAPDGTRSAAQIRRTHSPWAPRGSVAVGDSRCEIGSDLFTNAAFYYCNTSFIVTGGSRRFVRGACGRPCIPPADLACDNARRCAPARPCSMAFQISCNEKEGSPINLRPIWSRLSYK